MSNPTAAAAATSARVGKVTAVPPAGSPAAVLSARSGLRMRPHRPMRALAGALIVVASIVAALALYARIGDRREVLALARDVPAGAQLTDDDLAVVALATDDAIASMPVSQRDAVVGQYARVSLLAGSLLAGESLQLRPLVDPDRVLMSVVVPAGLVPAGLREQARIALVVTPPTSGGDRPPPILVDAIVAAVPRGVGGTAGAPDAVEGTVALSVEVPPEYVGVVGEAQAVSVGVLAGSSAFPGDQVTVDGGAPGVEVAGGAAAAEPAGPATSVVATPADLATPTTVAGAPSTSSAVSEPPG